MAVEARVPVMDLLICLGETVDMMCPAVRSHHMQVAYIAYALARELGLPTEEQHNVLTAGAVHDIGAFSLKERKDTLAFEMSHPHAHARAGYNLLDTFEPLREAARLVRFHHVPWENGAGEEFDGEEVPMGSHLLHLADRIAVSYNKNKPPLAQAPAIAQKIAGKSGSLFVPTFVEALNQLVDRDYFWFDVASHSPARVLSNRVDLGTLDLGMSGLEELGLLLQRFVDFKSRFTVTHTSGVCAVVMGLGRLMGLCAEDVRRLGIAACFHDLGKIAIPQEILEKPSKLDDDEFSVMRGHVYFAYRLLEPVHDLHTIMTWAALHQERLDGSGYPFGVRGDAIPQGARLMAVADVFVALTEDRPYRAGMPEDLALTTLQQMASMGKLDHDIVAKVVSNSEELNTLRNKGQKQAHADYQAFMDTITK